MGDIDSLEFDAKHVVIFLKRKAEADNLVR